MKKLLIILPTSTEAEQIITRLNMKPLSDKLFSNKNIDLLICGAGIPASIINTCLQLSKKKYDLVILCGIAGTYTNKFSIGDIVNVTIENFADIGYIEHHEFKNLFHIQDWNIEYNNGTITNTNSHYTNKLHIPECTSNTVNTCNNQIKGFPNADIENMEGAGLFMLLSRLNIPFLEIRCISNIVKERNKKKWDIPLSIKNLSNYICNIIETL